MTVTGNEGRESMEDKVFFLELMRTGNAHGRACRQGFARLDISTGVPKILYILEVNEGCVQKELARLCQVKESTLTVMLKRLEDRGFIRKEAVSRSGGKRAFGIYLTDSGRDKAKKVRNLVESIDAKCLEGFSAEERELFYSYLARVRGNLEALDQEE